jgi:predicted Zn-dependent peptidase
VKQTIHSHRFANGLVLVAEPIAGLESAAFTFLVPAGCRHDPPQRAGLAAFTMEMALRGAGTRDSRAFVQDLENLGVERSESVSAAHASYSGATLADHLLPALEIYTDLLRRPHLPADQLEAGRLLVLQELRAIEDEPSQKVMIELKRRQYPTPWGRPSQGEEAALLAITIGDIRRCHAGTYRPNGAILGVAGRFDWQRLVERVGELFGDWPAVELPEPIEGPEGSNQTHLDHDTNQTQIGVAFRSVPYRHEDYFRAWGAVGVLSGGMSSRLFTEVRERRGLCYSIHASLHTLRDRAAVFCYAGTSADRAQETLDVTIEQLERLARGIEPYELSRLQARIKSALIMQQESSASRSSAVAGDWYHLGRVRPLAEVASLVDGLTCESINAFLAENPPRDFRVVTLGPRALTMPREAA